MIDFHSHFLPNMDDGSKSIDESIAMLRESASQGVEAIVATPHFYAERTGVNRFLERRADRFGRVSEAIKGMDDVPRIYLGAEVLYFKGMSEADMIPKLTLDGTNVLLLEMPFAQWDEQIVREVERLIRKQKLTVVLAHLDRYIPLQKNPFYLNELLNLPVKVQLNAGAFLHLRKRAVLTLIRQGRVDALGSDCHNMTSRKPNLGAAEAVIRKKLGEESLAEICGRTRSLLTGIV